MRTRSSWLAANVMTLALFAPTAEAVITQVAVNPAEIGIGTQQPGTATLTWQATSAPVTGGGGGAGSTVTSPQGLFRSDGPNGPVIGTSNVTLQMIAQGPPRAPAVATVAETVSIPLSVLNQARFLGASRIVYQRVFLDGTPQPPGSGNTGNSTFTLLVTLSANVTPPIVNVAANQSSSAVLTWRIVSDEASGLAVSSTQGLFRAGGATGRVIGSSDQALTGQTRPSGATSMVMLAEALQIPAQILLRAQQLGASQVSYQRVFAAPGVPPVTATAVLGLTGGLASRFTLNQVALRFEDGAREATIAPGSEAFVFADLTHTGTGRLEARWEVAEPASTRGVPLFRNLSLVRKDLVGSGALTTIRSPRLPADADGAYLVRLSITQPGTGQEPAQLRYFVNPALSPANVVALVATSPAAGVVFRAGMRFGWQPAADAASYRLEFHDNGAPAAPLSGVVVPAAINETQISRLALSHLPAGRAYWWRVVAFDRRGRVVAHSELRRLAIPADDDST
jgi:hypothetical protein